MNIVIDNFADTDIDTLSLLELNILDDILVLT